MSNAQTSPEGGKLHVKSEHMRRMLDITNTWRPDTCQTLGVLVATHSHRRSWVGERSCPALAGNESTSRGTA